MIATIAAASLVVYGFAPGQTHLFDMSVGLDGNLPVFGGSQGQADVRIRLAVAGLEPDDRGRPRVSHELQGVRVFFNDTEMPFSVENLRPFFPKTTVTISAEGAVLESNAPNVALPVRLPGLDPRRFPEITYLPVEFPKEGVRAGEAFRFRRPIGGSDVQYTVTPTRVTDETIELDVAIAQTIEGFEDSSGAVVAGPTGATWKVVTTLTGNGKIVFDRRLGLARSVSVDADSRSKMERLVGNETRERSLKTTLRVDWVDPTGSRPAGTGSGLRAGAPTGAPTARWIGRIRLPDPVSSLIDNLEGRALAIALRVLSPWLGRPTSN
ncbi:MAG: hypothetical protein SNJ76_03395 [Fimbriimonadaceae bacterium]